MGLTTDCVIEGSDRMGWKGPCGIGVGVKGSRPASLHRVQWIWPMNSDNDVL